MPDHLLMCGVGTYHKHTGNTRPTMHSVHALFILYTRWSKVLVEPKYPIHWEDVWDELPLRGQAVWNS